jgi:hypothetical protein
MNWMWNIPIFLLATGVLGFIMYIVLSDDQKKTH